MLFCVILTPTAIIGNQMFRSATMYQPSSSVHSKLQYTQPLSTQRKHRKKQEFNSNVFGVKLLHACTSGVRVSVYNQLVICWGEVSMLPIQRWDWLLMCHASSTHHRCKPLADGLAPLPELLASKIAIPHVHGCSLARSGQW